MTPGRVDVRCGDCLELMADLPDSSVDLIATDPPYYRVKDLPWDRQWDTAEGFLAWMGRLCEQWRRVLRPNGSLYVFASPRMAARVEVEVGKRFNVLNNIVWNKLSDYESGDRRATAYKARDHGSFRRFFDYSERIIFAEHFGADGMAKGEAGYAAKCDELRGFVFEPILRYITGQFEASNLNRQEVDEHFGTSNVAQYWLQPRGFIIPTADKWAGLRAIRPAYFRLQYEALRRQYEDLRRQYEDLRRPFAVTADVPYTDVWDFPTVKSHPGKHPCEKPAALCEHIVRTSSRPGDAVLDCFAGSGSMLKAARDLGRNAIGMERDAAWVARIRRRLDGPPTPLFRAAATAPVVEQPSLF